MKGPNLRFRASFASQLDAEKAAKFKNANTHISQLDDVGFVRKVSNGNSIFFRCFRGSGGEFSHSLSPKLGANIELYLYTLSKRFA